MDLGETLPTSPSGARPQSTPTLPPELQAALADPARRFGHYVVLDELGRGGMGVVLRAFDLTLRRYVALKMILDPSWAGPEQVRRFHNEAAAVARLQHPGIVSVHEAGEHAGRPYLVLELVDGTSLETLLERGHLSAQRIAEIVRQIALALEHAHRSGVIHRDVKPENVLVDREGRPRLMDFGLAREVSSTERLTQTGQALGTPAYMAPEQAAGDLRAIGPRTDVYALGGLLYRALVGRPPFEASTVPELFRKLFQEEPAPPRTLVPGVPRDLETVALRCLAKEPERRYPSAAALAEDLRCFLEGEPIAARPTGRLERLGLWIRRNRQLATALAGLGLVLAIALPVGTKRFLDDLERRHTEEAEEERRCRLGSLDLEARTELEKGNLAGALALAGQALDLDPKNAPAWANRGEARLRKGELEPAIQDLTRAIALDPILARAWSSRGAARRKKGDLEALNDLSHAIELDPRPALFWSRRAEAHDAAGMPAEAIKDLSRAIEVEPRRASLLSQRGYLRSFRSSARDAEGASADAARALEIDPGDALAWVVRGLLRGSDHDAAIEAFTKALSLDPRLAVAWMHRGTVRFEKEDWDGALADETRAIELDPSVHNSWNTRGGAWLEKHEHAKAIADFTKAIELVPLEYQVWKNRGAARLRSRDVEGAIADLSHALDLKPTYAVAWCDRGIARREKGDYQGAVIDFSRAIELDPHYAEAFLQRCHMLDVAHQLGDALADAARAVELEPARAAAWFAKGRARRLLGKLDLAIEDLSQAIQLDPRWPYPYLERGAARETRHENEAALADFEKFLELAPGDDPEVGPARKMIEELGRRK